MKKLLCFLFGHNFHFFHRANGNMWGWNVYRCKQCRKEINTLVD